MSRHILDALMRLFALITLREEGLEKGREVVAHFLRSRLSKESVTQWLEVFEQHLVQQGGSVEAREVAGLKRTALRSTKVLRTCTDINRDLQASEKALVFLRMLEFEHAILPDSEDQDTLGRELIDLVAEVFGIREGEKRCYETLVFDTGQWPVMTQRYHEAFLIGDQPQLGGVVKPGWTTPLACFRHPESQVVFVRPLSGGAVQLNGELLDPQRTQPFTPGSTLRHPGSAPLHFVDIQRSFMEEENIPELTLEVNEVSHWFHIPTTRLCILSGPGFVPECWSVSWGPVARGNQRCSTFWPEQSAHPSATSPLMESRSRRMQPDPGLAWCLKRTICCPS